MGSYAGNIRQVSEGKTRSSASTVGSAGFDRSRFNLLPSLVHGPGTSTTAQLPLPGKQ